MFKKKIPILVMVLFMAVSCSCSRKEETPQQPMVQEIAEDEEVIAEGSGNGQPVSGSGIVVGSVGSESDIVDPGESSWEGRAGLSPDDLPVLEGGTLAECITLCDIDGLRVDFDFVEEPTEEEAVTYARLMKEARLLPGNDVQVQQGDVVSIDMYADDDTLTVIGKSVRVGQGIEPEEIENALIGMTKGEEKGVSVTYPENYYFQGLNGRTIFYNIIVNSIARSDEPIEVEVGQAMSYLEQEADQINRVGFARAVMEAFVKNSEFHAYPEKMVREARSRYEQKYIAGFSNIDEFLNAAGMTRAEFREIEDKDVSQRAKEQLVLLALQEETGITTSSAEYRQYAAAYGVNEEDPDETLFEVIADSIKDRLDAG